MSNVAPPKTFETWLAELEVIAESECCEWLVSSQPDYHRKAFDEGVSPEEEFERLQKVGGWSGCGCGS